jgi:molybdenum cofactor biosynthesis enzyme MoaA
MLDEREIRYIVTQRCIFNCIYCHAEGMKDPSFHQELLTPDDYAFIFRRSKEHGIKTATLSGGEPLVREDITEIAKKLKDEGCQLSVITNGYLITERKDLWDFVDDVKISIDTLDPKRFEEVRGLKGSFPRVIAGVKYLQKNTNVNIKLNAVSLKDTTEKEMKSYLDFAAECDATPRYIELYPSSESKLYLPHTVLIEDLEKLGYKEVRRKGRKIMLQNEEKRTVELLYIMCGLAKMEGNPHEFCKANNEIFLSPNGRLKVCRESDMSISIINEVKARDSEKLDRKILGSFDASGLRCW